MAYYSKEPLDDRSVSWMSGSQCTGYGAGASHERIIQGAGGEIGYDGFKDPRPGESGNIKADRVFINDKTNQIQGINFTKDGKFCCSYTGMDYQDIKDSNRQDCQSKQNQIQNENNSKSNCLYGIDVSESESHGQSHSYNGGITRR